MFFDTSFLDTSFSHQELSLYISIWSIHKWYHWEKAISKMKLEVSELLIKKSVIILTSVFFFLRKCVKKWNFFWQFFVSYRWVCFAFTYVYDCCRSKWFGITEFNLKKQEKMYFKTVTNNWYYLSRAAYFISSK